MLFALLALGLSIQPHRPAIKTRFTKKIVLPKNYHNGIGCDMCQQVVQYIEKLLLDKTVETEIATLVEQLCTSFPSPYDSLCKSIIESYLPTVLEWIEEGIDSLDICVQIGLCGTTKPIRRTNIKKMDPIYANNDEVCDMCNELIQRAKSLLENQTVEEEISAAALNYCNELSWPTSTVCKNMVNTYLPSFLEWLDEDIDTLDVCVRIGVCLSRKNSKLQQQHHHHHHNHHHHHPNRLNRFNNKGGEVCTTCKTLIDRAKVYLLNSTAEEEIEENLKGYCSTLSWPMNDLCKSLVTQYIPTLITYIEEGIDTETICATLGYCTTTIRRADKCQTCQTWFKWAENKLDDVTVAGLWKLVSEECPKVPYLNYFCQTITEQNIEQFVSLILSNLPPQQCCEWVKLC